MTSMFDRDQVGPAINKTHIAVTVSGMRPAVPDGWTRRTRIETPTPYGRRVDMVYEYPDGTRIVR